MKKQILIPKQLLITAGVATALLSTEAVLIQSQEQAFLNGQSEASTGLVFAEEVKKKRKVRRTPALRNKVYEQMVAAQKLIDEKKVSEGMKILEGMLALEGRRSPNSYERAMVWRTIANVHLLNENYKKALFALEKVVEQPNIPEAMETQILYTVAQIQMMLEEYSKAIKSLNKWFDVVETPSVDAYILLGQAYLQKKQWDPALKNVKKGIALAESRQLAKRETWYILLRVLYYEKKDIPKVVETLELLAENWPKREYFTQLAAMYGEQNKEEKQLHILEVAYQEGMLKRGSELLMMAQLYAANDMPYKAAKLMDKGIKQKKIKSTARNLEFLGDAWRRSQEVRKAVPELERAAEKSDKGTPYIRLAHIYISIDENDKAVKAVRKALKKGGIKRPKDAQILLGQSLFYTNQFDQAKKTFKALRDDKEKGAVASQWLSYVEREAERRRQIDEYLK